jgi:hypothetical protein
MGNLGYKEDMVSFKAIKPGYIPSGYNTRQVLQQSENPQWTNIETKARPQRENVVLKESLKFLSKYIHVLVSNASQFHPVIIRKGRCRRGGAGGEVQEATKRDIRQSPVPQDREVHETTSRSSLITRKKRTMAAAEV